MIGSSVQGAFSQPTRQISAEFSDANSPRHPGTVAASDSAPQRPLLRIRLNARRVYESVRLGLHTLAAFFCVASVSFSSEITVDLDILRGDFPRTLVFREVERLGKGGLSYEEWARALLPHGGFIGKAENERIPGRSELLPWYNRFKKENPHKMVLIHYLFLSRDIKDIDQKYSAPHWIHYVGTKGLSAIPGTRERTQIKVGDVGRIAAQGGSLPDVSICGLLSNGRPDWRRCETATVVEVRPDSGTVVVDRARYRSEPGAFAADRSYIAARAMDEQDKISSGPSRNWFYNFSVSAPVDAGGSTAAEILSKELAEKFAAGGRLQLLDGIAFDVFRSRVPFRRLSARIDLDGNGQPDDFRIADDEYSLGVYRFSEMLRGALGPDKIIIGEGWSGEHQQNFGVLNGIESEGWPAGHADTTMSDWSGGMNRHLFWLVNGYPNNRFDYFVYKYRIKKVRQEVSFKINRLFMAGALFTDSAVSQAYLVGTGRKQKRGEEFSFTFLDEAVKGAENRPGWLGQPTSPPVRLAKMSPDLWQGGDGLARATPREGTAAAPDGPTRRFSSAAGPRVEFRLPRLAGDRGDLTIFLELRGQARRGRPPAEGRFLRVRAVDGRTGDLIQSYYGFLNQAPFEFSYMVGGVAGRDVVFEVDVEGGEPVWLSRMSAYSRPDAMYRTFEHGIVLANPGTASHKFDLDALVPGSRYRRLIGREDQDPRTNDGSIVSAPVVLSKDALVLERIED